MTDWSELLTQVGEQTNLRLFQDNVRQVGGGSIHHAYRLQTDSGPVFLKLNVTEQLAGFEAEAAGLEALAATNTLRVPRVLGCGRAQDTAYLLLEWLELGGSSATGGRSLGEGLAALHRYTGKAFGFARDNFIGSTPQPNPWTDDWIEFFREQRLGFQLRLAVDNGFGFLQVDGRRLMDSLDGFFDAYQPEPSLLHGDLWAGNQGCTGAGEPVIFDPAVYYGDRETDIAMTGLFGGFSREFYQSYEAAWPLSTGWEARAELYQLYHVLNHANLFGGGYARDAHGRIRKLLDRLPGR